ncbi:MAG: DMT family transporter [Sulfobacillus sp.]
MSNRRAIFFLIVANLLWAGNYLAGRVLRTSMGPFTLNGVRWVISAILLVWLVRRRGESLPIFRQWRIFLGLGLVGMFLFSSLTYWGLTMVGAGEAGLLSGLTPIAVLLAGFFIAQDRVHPAQWVMVLVSVAGEVLLLHHSGTNHAAAGSLFGAVILIIAALSWGVYTALGRRYRAVFSPLVLTAGAAVWGAVPSALLGIWDLGQHLVIFTPVSVGALIYVSTLASVLAFVVWSAGVNEVGSAVAAPFMNLLPVFTVALAVLLLHEQLGLSQIEGGVVIIAGAVGASLFRIPAPRLIEEE